MRKGSIAKAAMAILLVLSIASVVPNARSLSNAFPMSSKVALVPGPRGEVGNGGGLPTTGFPNGDTFTFVNLAPNSIANDATDPIVAGGFDTVVLVQVSLGSNPYGGFTDWWTTGQFASRITSFVNNGGKLIIYDSEITWQDYSTFIYPFSENSPGAQGSYQGQLWIVENNTLGSNSTAIPPEPSYCFVNTALIGTQTEIGDANVMVTQDSHWKTHMVATNTNSVTGPVHTYAEYGSGLIIWNGQDMDPFDYGSTTGIDNTNGGNAMGVIWYLELKQGFNPTNPPLIGSVGTSGLSLLPGTSSNVIGTTHTVTAIVTDSLGNAVPSVLVSFDIISGPNAGLTGTGTTNSLGQAIFSWSSSFVGTDNVTASITTATGKTITTSALKTWTYPSSVLPEAPYGTIATTLALFAAFGLFMTKNRFLKTPKHTRN